MSEFAPVRLSTMTGCPNIPVMSCAMMRAITSVGPPAAKPTTTRMGFMGKSWAAAAVQMSSAAARSSFGIIGGFDEWAVRPGRILRTKPGCHHLAAFDESMLVGPIVGYGVVDRAEVFPHENVTLAPGKYVLVFRPRLVREQVLEHLGAFLLRKLVDAYRVARVGVQHFASGERVRQENRVRHRRFRRALCFGERRALAAPLAPHHVPEFV